MECQCQQKVAGSVSNMNQQINGSISNTLSIETELSLQNEVISSNISNIQQITGEIQDINLQSLSGNIITLPAISGQLSIGKTDYPIYRGVYQITPLVGLDIILQTSNKLMQQDVIVNEIPYYQTSNLSGGYTVIIG